MRINRPLMLGALVSLLLPVTAAYAAGSARFSTGDPNVPTLTFSWQDVAHSRLDTPNQPAHVLAIDGKAWGVASVAGRPVSMDLESLAKLLGKDSSLTQLGPNTVVPAQLTAMERTGQTETVAGIQGEVYRVSWQDSNGKAHVDEAVFTGDALVQEMQTALIGGMTRAIASGTGVSGHEQAQRELERRGLAVLRFGDDFRLESIERSDQPDERFALPGKPVDLQRMMRGMMGG
ncbi:hypothetical protein LV476_02675 [Guyparkeria hydrothermalis]|uniref:hypothetical protein n=1 Tax=Guyparkeria hydrothermalis TaxID=923 RepID=UPI0020221526|nr:hypothetical protein [Guyparkeria hydrothermalis]MCL7743858.1 hypothetical protein [Guyparkeria hydrothermalis]